MRVAYYKIMKDVDMKIIPLFNENIELMCYGDDNIMGVDDGFKMFNHTSVSNALAEYGIVYTMADKTSASIPFLHISSCDFLKRKFVFSEELQKDLCPIDETSIQKMLHCVIKSKVLTMDEQCSEVICCANREYFQYGREVFDMRHEQLQRIIDMHHLNVFCKDFKSYDELNL
jgi:hypothetical protein